MLSQSVYRPLILGGDTAEDESLSSTEIWDGKTWKKHVRLPKPLESHCLVRINTTHFFLTGGEYDDDDEDSYSLSSYIFNGKEFVQVYCLGERPKKKLRKFGHMSKLGVPYLPCSLVWTKMNLDKYSSVYPTYLPKKVWTFWT